MCGRRKIEEAVYTSNFNKKSADLVYAHYTASCLPLQYYSMPTAQPAAYHCSTVNTYCTYRMY